MWVETQLDVYSLQHSDCWTYYFLPTKCFRNNLSTPSLNFSIYFSTSSLFVDKHKILFQFLLDNSQQRFQHIFSFTCSWLNIKDLGVPNGFSVHRKYFSPRLDNNLYHSSTFFFQNFLSYIQLDFSPLSYLTFLFKGKL